MLLCLPHQTAAQELEPGLYLNAPTHLNLVVVGYTFSTGNVLVDASLPLEGVRANLHLLALGYLRTLDVFGRSAKLDVQVPVSWGTFEGFVADERRTRSPAGIADPRIRVAVNLLGAPALPPDKFGGYRQGTVVGASLQVALPLGQYDPDRLINLGSNRWSFRPELGISHARGRWLVEMAGGAWFFTANDEYFGGRILRQRPLYFLKMDAIYALRRGMWISANYGYATGGATTIDGVFRHDLQRNNRIGGTVTVPTGRATALKVTYTSGLTTRLGSDFDSIGASYQYTWR